MGHGPFLEKVSDAQQQRPQEQEPPEQGKLEPKEAMRRGAHGTELPPIKGFFGSQVLDPGHTRDTNIEFCDASLIISTGL